MSPGIRAMRPVAAWLLVASGCGPTPSSVPLDGTQDDAGGDGDVSDASADLMPSACAACLESLTFPLDETAGPYVFDATGQQTALVNDGVSTDGVLLGQPGPPGFGSSICLFGGGTLQFLGSAFDTLSARHTLEFVIQPQEDGLALLWTNDSGAGWRVLFSNRTMLSTFDPSGGTNPPPLQGEPRWDAGEWYHAAVVRDGASVRAYLGGQLTGEQAAAENDVAVPGLRMGSPTLDFQGCLAWVRLWPCACYAGDAIAPPAAASL